MPTPYSFLATMWKAVEDVQRLGTFLADHVQGKAASMSEQTNSICAASCLSDDGEETLEGFEGAFLADPEQAGEPRSIW